MLTKQDLSQIKSIIQTETRSIVQSETRSIVQSEIEKGLKPIKQDIKTMKEDITFLREASNAIISYFESEYLSLRKRVERIEEHLNLT